MPIGTSMRRSFSDSHLETLKEAREVDISCSHTPHPKNTQVMVPFASYGEE